MNYEVQVARLYPSSFCIHTLLRSGQGYPTFDTAQAIAVLLEKHGIACDIMYGFNWDKWTLGKPTERLQLIPAGQEHILEQEEGKQRWVKVVAELSSAFALSAASEEAAGIRDDVSFFQAFDAPLDGGGLGVDGFYKRGRWAGLA